MLNYDGKRQGRGIKIGQMKGGVRVEKVYIKKKVKDIYVVNNNGENIN